MAAAEVAARLVHRLMRELLRRLGKLEEAIMPAPCICARLRGWIRLANHYGELEPDRSPEPPPINCPLHGEVHARQIVIQAIKADPINGGPAAGYKEYQA